MLVLLITFSGGSLVRAQKQVAESTASNKVLFIGMDQDRRLVFEVHLANLPERGNDLRITDEQDNILFEERINTRTYLRRYKIERSEWSPISQIYFEVINRKTLLREKFQLNYRLAETWDVIKG